MTRKSLSSNAAKTIWSILEKKHHFCSKQLEFMSVKLIEFFMDFVSLVTLYKNLSVQLATHTQLIKS